MERYSVEKQIGKGNFGKVYKVMNLNGDTLAVKEVKLGSARQAEAAQNEIDVLRMISKPCIPSLVCYYTSFVRNNNLYIEMEYIDGINLYTMAQRSGNNKKFPSFLLAIMGDLTPGLKYLHSKNILHRDIKPENIMIDKKKIQPKLIDVGLACFPNQYLECDGNKSCCLGRTGSPNFMSPETLLDGIAYVESDIWSLGASIYNAATNHYVFEAKIGDIANLMKAMQDNPVELLPTNDSKLDSLLSSILQKDFNLRISADEILNIIMADYIR